MPLLTPGQHLDRYEVIAFIAAGGMGEVYHARHTVLGRDVALKIVFPHLMADAQASGRFVREAQAAARLRHPHIIEIFDAGVADGQHFMAMEYLPNGSLAQEIRALRQAGQRMPIAHAIEVAGQMALALDAAHRAGYVHRDVKPNNVLVRAAGHYVLTDFGLVLDAGQTRLTQAGFSMGTAAYMAPEQWNGQADARSDLYSLGITLFEMLAGDIPFSATTPFALMRQHVEMAPRKLTDARPDAPRALQAVLDRALAKRPQDRFQTGAAFAAALQAVAGPPAQSQPFGGPAATTLPMPKPAAGRPRAGLVAALAAGALLIAAVAGFALWPRGGTPAAAPTPAPSAPPASPRPSLPPEPTRALPPTAAPGATRAPDATPLPPDPTRAPPPTPPPARPTATLVPTPASQGRLAYTLGDSPNQRIMIVDMDTGREAPLPNQPADSMVPVWSPDGGALTFRAKVAGFFQVFAIKGDGSALRQVTRGSYDNFEAALSPDGAHIAFTSKRDGNQEIYVMDADGGNQQRLTQNPGWEDDAAWSPDGAWIAFESARGGRTDIYRMRADGSSLQRLTSDGESNYTPAWSHDGRWIAFERQIAGRMQVFVMPSGGGETRRVTFEGDNNQRAAWSPDGSEIACTSTRDGQDAIWVFAVNGEHAPRRAGSAGGVDPSWAPRAP